MLENLRFFGAVQDLSAQAGVIIPVTDLAGLDLAELEYGSITQSLGGSVAEVEAKFLYSFLEKVHSVLSPANFEKLGITVSKDTSDAGAGLVNFDFSLTVQYLERLNNTPIPLPIPTTGTNLGVGDFAFTSIFPNAQKVDSDFTVSRCVLIPTASLEPYGAPSHATLNLSTDSRAYLMALYRALASESTLRGNNTQSAITNRSVSTPVIVPLATAATNAVNPTTGIQPNSIPFRAKVSQNTFAISIQTQLTPSSMSYEIYSA